jgi:aminopeptidase
VLDVPDQADLNERLARLAVRFGAGVQPGQIVGVTSYVGKEAITRAVTREAYRAGARWVDVFYWDDRVKLERLLHAGEETLDYIPPWMDERLGWLADERAARVSISGPEALGAFDAVEPARAGRDLLPYLPRVGEIINARTTNWTVVPGPTARWARAVHPDLPEEEGLVLFWQEMAHVLRLDEPDPVAAWELRMDEIVEVGRRLTLRRFDAVRLHGPGTDLTIGLFPSSVWRGARFETVDGLVHHPNLPTEEVFTCPDPARAEGVVTTTKPKELFGATVEGVRIEFAGGRAVRIDAERGADTLRAAAAKDDGASCLGELALVDGSGRVGALGTVFHDTLLDENAASHLALGDGLAVAVADEDDRRRASTSAIHIDLMVGSRELAVDGITPSGQHVPVLRDGAWQV